MNKTTALKQNCVITSHHQPHRYIILHNRYSEVAKKKSNTVKKKHAETLLNIFSPIYITSFNKTPPSTIYRIAKK